MHQHNLVSSGVSGRYPPQLQNLSRKASDLGSKASAMRVLVIGGGGFLGGAIIKQLVARGDQVRSLSRGDYPWLRDLGVHTIQADLNDRAVLDAVEGCDVVAHVAAKAGIWGPLADYQRINVHGTTHILNACRKAGVPRLVYTSSPSVVHSGGDMENIDETMPYPTHFEAHYPATKAQAEQLVLAANSPSLATVALRPHLIWGPGDNHLVPRIIAKAKSGRLRRIGHRPCLVDSTYIDNAADAHILAIDRLAPGSPIAGKAYFIANGEPMPIWDLIDKILNAAGMKLVTKAIPVGVAYAAGAALEAIYSGLGRSDEPPLTRFMVKQLSTAHWFNLSAARRDLGYEPRISIEVGIQKLAESFQSGGINHRDTETQRREE